MKVLIFNNRLFKQTAAYKTFKKHFPLYSQEELLVKLEHSRQCIENGQMINAYDMVREVKEKYGL